LSAKLGELPGATLQALLVAMAETERRENVLADTLADINKRIDAIF
jgi:hypothetical protein